MSENEKAAATGFEHETRGNQSSLSFVVSHKATTATKTDLLKLLIPEVVSCSQDISSHIDCTQYQIKYHLHQNLDNEFYYVTVSFHPLLQWVIAAKNKTSTDRCSVIKFAFEAFKTS